MTEAEFDSIRAIVGRLTGIALSGSKRTLAESRLARRLRHHRMRSFTEYLGYLAGRPDGDPELGELVNCITTNKTAFFREPHHFEFLAREVLPALRTGPLHVWS
ncbi:MAG: chemotaxis protein CheR, partial [Rudaea sp.]